MVDECSIQIKIIFFNTTGGDKKHKNDVSNVLDTVKARLRRIANRIDLEEFKESAKSLKEWEFYGKKVKIMV